MLRAGVSTACLYPRVVEEALYDLALSGVSHVEIFINSHSELRRSFVDTLARLLQRFDMTCASLHPYTCEIEPNMLFSNYARRVDDYLEYCRYYFTAMQQLGAKVFVLHGNKVPAASLYQCLAAVFAGDAGRTGQTGTLCAGHQAGSAFRRRSFRHAPRAEQPYRACAHKRPRGIRGLSAAGKRAISVRCISKGTGGSQSGLLCDSGTIPQRLFRCGRTCRQLHVAAKPHRGKTLRQYRTKLVRCCPKERNCGVMNCPFCGHTETRVLDSRPHDERIRRRRECLGCGKRFTTYEAVDRPMLMVQKKDGSYEPFDRHKLVTGIFNAIKKRPVNSNLIVAMVEELEDEYSRQMRSTVTSSEIGNAVMERLKYIDAVAYVRFASVYQDFTDVAGFLAVIGALDKTDEK